MPTVRYLHYTVRPHQAGMQVGTLLRDALGMSGAVVRRMKWLPDGITLDGVRVTVRAQAMGGQVLRLRLSDPDSAPQPVPHPGPLRLVYEDGDLAVVDKAPGVLVHPSHGHHLDTMGNALMAHWQARDEGAGFHPVHRLDKGTTGLLVVAKHPYAQQRLSAQLHTGGFRRTYVAVCDAAPQAPEGWVDAPIAPVPGSLMARRVDPAGQCARTHYRTVAQCGPRTLVELELDTGRTHQIRVHMAHLGCPLTGDFLYGTEQPHLISRPALHSARLTLTHPVTGAALTLSAPLPGDMAALVPAAAPYISP